MRYTTIILVTAALAACGGGEPHAVRIDDRERAGLEKELDRVHPPPKSALWADGYGRTQRDAVLEARRAVSEQISARLSSRLQAHESEAGGKGERTVDARVQTETEFEHAELIQVYGEMRRGDTFVVRAMLNKKLAAEVYRQEQDEDRKRLAGLHPIVEKALAEHDTAVLLSSDQSPGEINRRMNRRARILALLDAGEDVRMPRKLERLEARAANARQGALLRLRVEGEAGERLRRAALDEVGKLLSERGCRFVEGADGPPPDGVPTADVALRLASREHQEHGVNWRYLGLEVEALDARNGRTIFRFAALPELVHGGGKSWEQADQAVARALGPKLTEKGRPRFAHLTCR